MNATHPLSLTKAWLLGLGAIVGSGIVATGLGYLVELVALWAGISG